MLICIRYMYPYIKGKLLFKIIRVYHGREKQIRQWGRSFSREYGHDPWQGIFFAARALDQGIYYVTQEILFHSANSNRISQSIVQQ